MYKTSQWVSLGHPDKIADYISERILDEYLKQDPLTRYALQVQIKDNYVTLGGQITSKAGINRFNRVQLVKQAVAEIGYTKEYQQKWGKENTICDQDIFVEEHISEQSPDIATGVNTLGWGDQGIFWGMATNDVKYDYMPKDYYLAKKIGQELFKRQIGGLDIKTQVTLKNNEIYSIIVAIPTLDDIDTIKRKVLAVIEELVTTKYNFDLIVNGTGVYKKHGPVGDCGTTGRKLAVDFYGGNCKIGGGSPWTKDGTKADLTLNLYARYLALQHIKNNLQDDEVYCSLACCIGKQDVVYSLCNKFGEQIEGNIRRISTKELLELFDLNKPTFSQLCRDGLFSKIK